MKNQSLRFCIWMPCPATPATAAAWTPCWNTPGRISWRYRTAAWTEFCLRMNSACQPVADVAVISAMAYIIGALRPLIRVPYGVNVVKNPIATIDLAAATGARFARSCFSGAYMGEYGLYTSNSGEAVRHRKALEIPDMKLLFKVNPEADSYLVQRDIQVVAKSIMFGGFADGLCVSGASAGSEPDDSILNKVYEVAKPRNVPVFCNSGCRHENVREKLKYCDAVCMGTAFKKDGVFNGRVDEERVRSFMEIVYDIRARL